MKPIDLIVANFMHEAATTHDAIIEKGRRAGIPEDKLRDIVGDGASEAMARAILCEISHNASLGQVMRALSALGVAATIDDLVQRFRATQDQRRSEVRA